MIRKMDRNLIKKTGAKELAIISCMLLFILMAAALSGRSACAKVTTAKTPEGAYNAHIKWQKKFGSGYANAVTPPLLVESDIYIGSGGVIYRLNKDTGKIKSKLKVEGVFGYTTIAPAYNGKDKIFIPLSQGRIQAIDITGSSMKKVWTSQSFGDQAIVPLEYSDGKIYTGTYGKKNSFVSIDEQSGQVIQLASNEYGGFYWTGAYISEKAVVFGEEADDKGKSLIRSIDISKDESKTGNGTGQPPKLISSQTVEGPVRSTMVKEGEYLFFVSKGKYLYKMKFDEDEGSLEKPVRIKLSGEATGVPLVHGGSAYIGTSAGKIDIIDTAGMKRLYQVKTPGYIQGEMLLSTGVRGKPAVYGAYNNSTGGLFYMQPGQSKAIKSGNLLIPDHKQFCISPVICDAEGTIYYKNDSGYIMAVAEGFKAKAPKIKTKTKKKRIMVSWKQNGPADGYVIYRSAKKKGKFKKIKTINKAAIKKYTDKKVKSKRKYYYRMKSWKKVNGKKVYSTFSNTSYKRVK